MIINKLNGTRIVEVRKPLYFIRNSHYDPYSLKNKIFSSVAEVSHTYMKNGFDLVE